MNPNLSELRAKAASLPLEPGVYLMKDASGGIIYVGKAKLLRNRVSSYFRSVEKHLPKVGKMVDRVRSFDYIVTDSEFEALILECSLIKLHSPKYNILLKDDKGYHYIKVSGGDWPRLTAEHNNDDPAAAYIGPYSSSAVTRQTVEEANRVFRLPDCSRRFPEDFGKYRPCLNYHIKQCMGVCSGRVPQAAYREAVDGALDFIHTGGPRTLELLTSAMQEASDAMDYERAARYRDRIAAINRITDQQKVIAYNHKSLDVIGAVQGEETLYLSVLVFRDGRLVDKRDSTYDCLESMESVMGQFIYNSYYMGRDVPSEVFIGFELPEAAALEKTLSEANGKKLTITVPRAGKPLQVMEMAKNNAGQSLAIRTGRTGREISALTELGRLLALPAPPDWIEAYDISNYGGQTIVGGMVVFEDGRPSRRFYKKFTIRDQTSPDDYAAMEQMLTRRFTHYAQGDSDEGFARLPDLILMDGGAQHVAVAQRVLASFDLRVPVFGMVKDSRHRTRAITAENGEIAISADRGVFALVTSVQDEVHRYAISFSQQRHGSDSFATRLTGVPGIGETRARNLYRRFKTWKAMTEASAEELAGAEGMTRPAAENLHAFLHPQD